MLILFRPRQVSPQEVGVGDLVKIYPPLFANVSFFIASVIAVPNSSCITLDQVTTNNVFIGSGFKMDLIHTYKYQAWRNMNNDNKIRYYNSQGAYFEHV